LFAHHRGDWTLSTEISGMETQPIYASATRNDEGGEVIVKVVTPGEGQVEAEIALAGSGKVQGIATAIVLAAAGLEQQNTLAQPNQILPEEAAFTITGNPFVISFKPHSLTVLRVKTRVR
jgi:alpha-L-arabinofuranosidase